MPVTYRKRIGAVGVEVSGPDAEATFRHFQDALSVAQAESLSEVARKVRAADVRENPDAIFEARKQQAIRLLTELYRTNMRDEVRKLLPLFGVEKFSEVPLGRAEELLGKAIELDRRK